MQPQRLREIQIKVRIVPKRVLWPEGRSNPVWVKAHGCVDALEELVRNVDSDCLQAEQSKELTASAIRRRRAEISDHALEKLVNFPAFEIAEKELKKTSMRWRG